MLVWNKSLEKNINEESEVFLKVEESFPFIKTHSSCCKYIYFLAILLALLLLLLAYIKKKKSLCR